MRHPQKRRLSCRYLLVNQLMRAQAYSPSLISAKNSLGFLSIYLGFVFCGEPVSSINAKDDLILHILCPEHALQRFASVMSFKRQDEYLGNGLMSRHIQSINRVSTSARLIQMKIKTSRSDEQRLINVLNPITLIFGVEVNTYRCTTVV